MLILKKSSLFYEQTKISEIVDTLRLGLEIFFIYNNLFTK